MKQPDMPRKPTAMTSHPTRVRELKLHKANLLEWLTAVAPHAGA